MTRCQALANSVRLEVPGTLRARLVCPAAGGKLVTKIVA
jgi:hypothetical protein